MLWKELNFSIKKYFIYVFLAAIFIMFINKYYLSSSSDLLPSYRIAAVKSETLSTKLFSVAKELFDITYVDGINAGNASIQGKKGLDAFIYFDTKKQTVKVAENKSIGNTAYIGLIVEEIMNKSQFTFKFLGQDTNKLKKLLNSFIFILSFVCFLIPYRMFSDEKKTLKAIVFSPIKNNEIIISKTIGTILLYSVAVLYFYVINDISIKEVSLLFLVGLIYIAFGMFMGIYADSKIVSAAFYPLMLLVIIFPYISNNTFSKLSAIFDIATANDEVFCKVSFSLFGIFLIFMVIVNHTFAMKLRRERI